MTAMPAFDLYCKTDALRQRLVPLLAQIPFFTFTVRTGTPEVRYFDQKDPVWKGFPFPVPQRVAYVFDDDIPARALGGGMDLRAAIRVRPGDPDAVVILRLWHELLHAVGKPADDMIPLAAEWQTPWERLLWAVWRWLQVPVDVPFWHRRFYRWLTLREEGVA